MWIWNQRDTEALNDIFAKYVDSNKLPQKDLDYIMNGRSKPAWLDEPDVASSTDDLSRTRDEWVQGATKRFETLLTDRPPGVDPSKDLNKGQKERLRDVFNKWDWDGTRDQADEIYSKLNWDFRGKQRRMSPSDMDRIMKDDSLYRMQTKEGRLTSAVDNYAKQRYRVDGDWTEQQMDTMNDSLTVRLDDSLCSRHSRTALYCFLFLSLLLPALFALVDSHFTLSPLAHAEKDLELEWATR